MNQTLGVVSPEGLALGSTKGISPHLDTLEGKTIGEVYNNHFKGELMFHTYRRLFKEKYPGVKIIPYTEFPIVYVGGDPATRSHHHHRLYLDRESGGEGRGHVEYAGR